MTSSLYVFEDGEEFDHNSSPLFDRLGRPRVFSAFDHSPVRCHESEIINQALELQPDRQMLSYQAALQILAMKKDREWRTVGAAKAKARYQQKKRLKAD